MGSCEDICSYGHEVINGGNKRMARVIPIPVGPIYSGGHCKGLVHVVQKGDTLYELGKHYHVSVTQLMFANPFVDVYNLQIGDELCIPSVIQPRRQNRTQEEAIDSEAPQRTAPERMDRGMPPSGGENGMPQGMMPGSMESGMPLRELGNRAPQVVENDGVPQGMPSEVMDNGMPQGMWDFEPSGEIAEHQDK